MRASPPPFTKKHREHLSEARKGNKNSVGRTPWNKGKRGVQKSAMKGKKRPEYAGERHPNWKGGKQLQASRNRHAHERAMNGLHTGAEWQELKLRYGNKCAYCGTPESIAPLTKDHVYPVSKGGTDFINNIQPLCKRCNSRKKNKVHLTTRL